ncbi:MAG: hypothetical protein QXN46_01775 [Candidatus Woesearchaeota archaeon]
MLKDFFGKGLLNLGSHIGYFSGITTLVPVLSSALRFGKSPWSVFPPSFWIALALNFVSSLIIFFLKKSLSEGLRAIGMMTMIPGFFAVLFGIISQEEVFSALNAKFVGFSVIQPYVKLFVEHTVPKTLVVGILYILIGHLIWRIGVRLSQGF